ncbi:MAG: carboxypeptidase regulatory-like domain-containing protein [Acidobacteria bacterium]|nr:carboxypeptidase regulatory-like domain-containing protein [Acidobacteriota bacterium]
MSAHRVTVAALALLQAVASPAAHVSQARGLAGVVLQAENGAPIAGASVYAMGPPTRRLTTARSGTDGRWRMRDLPPGVYRVVVRAPGFAPAWVEPSGPPEAQESDRETGPRIRLAPEGAEDLVARLVRAGSLSGRVTTAAGVPVPDVVVTTDGGPVMGTPPIGQSLTDRDGRYRLEEVAAGERLVVVRPNRAPSTRAPDRGWSGFFHPGTTSRDLARAVSVRAGAHIGDVDILVSLPATHVVTSRLVGPDTADDVQVRLLSNGGRTLRTLSYLAGTGAIGPDIVDAGHYVVWARGRAGQRALAAWQAVEIAGDGALPGMTLVAAGTLRGRVRTESGALIPRGDVAVGSVLWIDGNGFEILGEREAQVLADGSFELDAILGPRRLHVRGLPDGWDVIDIRLAGKSVLASGIEVGPARIIDGVDVVVGQGR